MDAKTAGFSISDQEDEDSDVKPKKKAKAESKPKEKKKEEVSHEVPWSPEALANGSPTEEASSKQKGCRASR